MNDEILLEQRYLLLNVILLRAKLKALDNTVILGLLTTHMQQCPGKAVNCTCRELLKMVASEKTEEIYDSEFRKLTDSDNEDDNTEDMFEEAKDGEDRTIGGPTSKNV